MLAFSKRLIEDTHDLRLKILITIFNYIQQKIVELSDDYEEENDQFMEGFISQAHFNFLNSDDFIHNKSLLIFCQYFMGHDIASREHFKKLRASVCEDSKEAFRCMVNHIRLKFGKNIFALKGNLTQEQTTRLLKDTLKHLEDNGIFPIYCSIDAWIKSNPEAISTTNNKRMRGDFYTQHYSINYENFEHFLQELYLFILELYIAKVKAHDRATEFTPAEIQVINDFIDDAKSKDQNIYLNEHTSLKEEEKKQPKPQTLTLDEDMLSDYDQYIQGSYKKTITVDINLIKSNLPLILEQFYNICARYNLIMAHQEDPNTAHRAICRLAHDLSYNPVFASLQTRRVAAPSF